MMITFKYYYFSFICVKGFFLSNKIKKNKEKNKTIFRNLSLCYTDNTNSTCVKRNSSLHAPHVNFLPCLFSCLRFSGIFFENSFIFNFFMLQQKNSMRIF